MSPLAILDACFVTLKPTLTFLLRRQFKLLFAHDVSDGPNPHGVTRVSFHLTFDSQKPRFSPRGVRVVRLDGSSSISASYESGLPALATELCRAGKKGLPFWPQISRESKLVSSKSGLPLCDLQPPQRRS